MKKSIKKKMFIIVAIILILLLILGAIFGFRTKSVKVDDWKYNPKKVQLADMVESLFQGTSKSTSTGYSSSSSAGIVSGVEVCTDSASSSSSIVSSYSTKKTDSYIGYTVGGASNIDSFRQNIQKNYLPLSTDITYNGLFSEYYFDTGKTEIKENKKFYPSYSCAVSEDPLSNEKEYYMSIGLNSNLKESDFERKKVNLVIVLDISGSMGSGFSSYYYDGTSNSSEDKSKMKIAEECINNMLEQLNPDDRFGMVLFDDQAYLGKEIRQVSETDIEAIQNHILEIEEQGGTNFSAGYNKATKLFEEYKDDSEYQNRIVVVTDAMPNLGDTSSDGLYSSINENADDEIYTSFIGVGVDFNTELIEKISDVEGANYYSVHDSEEFNKTLVEEFDYMITPLVYDLNLDFESDDYTIENIYGTDFANKSTGNIVHVNTLFPSSSNSDGEVKGGIIVLKLKKNSNSNSDEIKLNISYRDNSNIKYTDSEEVKFKDSETEYYDNTGIQKAIVLSRYVNSIKNWIIYEKSNNNNEFYIDETTGIKEFDYEEEYIQKVLGQNERKSTKLTVSENYKEIFKKMKTYIEDQNKILKDDTLKEEIKILDKLI